MPEMPTAPEPSVGQVTVAAAADAVANSTDCTVGGTSCSGQSSVVPAYAATRPTSVASGTRMPGRAMAGRRRARGAGRSSARLPTSRRESRWRCGRPPSRGPPRSERWRWWSRPPTGGGRVASGEDRRRLLRKSHAERMAVSSERAWPVPGRPPIPVRARGSTSARPSAPNRPTRHRRGRRGRWSRGRRHGRRPSPRRRDLLRSLVHGTQSRAGSAAHRPVATRVSPAGRIFSTTTESGEPG